MQITMLKSKIHRATVTDANLDYVGSITIDEKLMKETNLYENEKVQIVNINNGERFETYVIKGPYGKGDICLNGAAARLVQPKDTIIIMAYCIVDENEAENFNPRVVFVDDNNKSIEVML